jgi:hypothetical protein
VKRVIFDLLLLISLFTLPWWVTVVVATGALFVFTEFYEFIVIGIVMFTVYRTPSPMLLASPVWFSFIVAIVYGGAQMLRRYIIIYKA